MAQLPEFRSTIHAARINGEPVDWIAGVNMLSEHGDYDVVFDQTPLLPAEPVEVHIDMISPELAAAMFGVPVELLAAPQPEGFDPEARDVKALMERRSVQQSWALRSPMAMGAHPEARRVTMDVAAMRKAHRAAVDPLGLDDPVLSTQEQEIVDAMSGYWWEQ